MRLALFAPKALLKDAASMRRRSTAPHRHTPPIAPFEKLIYVKNHRCNNAQYFALINSGLGSEHAFIAYVERNESDSFAYHL